MQEKNKGDRVMLNVEEIHKEIKDLEQCDKTTYDVCKKLAILYTVRDHLKMPETKMNAGIGTSPEMMNAGMGMATKTI